MSLFKTETYGTAHTPVFIRRAPAPVKDSRVLRDEKKQKEMNGGLTSWEAIRLSEKHSYVQCVNRLECPEDTAIAVDNPDYPFKGSSADMVLAHHANATTVKKVIDRLKSQVAALDHSHAPSKMLRQKLVHEIQMLTAEYNTYIPSLR